MNQWAPEREITLDEALALIRSQCFVDFDEARILATGWDNTVVILDDDWVFRFPRRKIALPGIAREIDWLPWIADRVDLPVPVPVYVGDYDGWPFWGGHHLAGDELAQRPALDRVPVASAVGRFLAALHSTSLGGAPHVHLPIDPFGRADSASRAVRARDVLADLVEVGLWAHDPGITAVLDAGATLGPVTGAPVLSHGDLYSRHILVEQGLASGIIDWGDLCLAVPAVDLAVAWSAFSGHARSAFFDAYGSVDDETVLRAKTMAVFSAASIVHYAYDTGDEVLLAEALTGLQGIPH